MRNRLLVVCLAFVTLFLRNAHALEISGTFTLDPSINITHTTDITVRASYSGGGIGGAADFILNPGDNSTNFFEAFSFPSLPDGDGSGFWTLIYICNKFVTPEGCNDLVNTGYYSTDASAVSTTTYDSNIATELPDTVDSTGLEIAVYPGRPMTGKIVTPIGTVATEDIPVSIVVTPISTLVGQVASQSIAVVIPDQGTEVDWKVTLPFNTNETFRLKYACFGAPPGCAPYVQTGYFDDSAPGNASATIGDADLFDNMSSFSNVFMRLIPAETLSGVITLADPAPEGGLTIRATARNLTTQSTIPTTVDFDFGETVNGFSIPIPADDVDWRLSFTCLLSDFCQNYVATSFYKNGATNNLVYSTADAQLIDGGASVSMLNVTLATAPSISGTLSLSRGLAPEGGLRFQVTAREPVAAVVVSDFFTMDEGESELEYSIVIPNDGALNWRVEYKCQSSTSPLCSEVTEEGYYDSLTGDTLVDENAAATLAGGIDHDSIDLVVPSTFPDTNSLCVAVATNNGVVTFCL